jgi:FMN phosphatase YigB (HAD superfamily)
MEFILFDLDNTLYSAEQEVFSLIDRRINDYMVEIVGIPLDEVDDLRRTYWEALRCHHAGTDASPWSRPRGLSFLRTRY